MAVPKLVKKVLKKVLKDNKYEEVQNKYRDYVRNKIINKDMKQLLENYRQIMFQCGIYDDFDRIPTPYDIEPIRKHGSNGVDFKIKFPFGKSSRDIERNLDKLKENVYKGKSMVYLNDEKKYTTLSIIKDWHNVSYRPILTYKDKKGNDVKLTASQIFMGYDVVCEPIILDLSKRPHMLITGGSGGGKLLYF